MRQDNPEDRKSGVSLWAGRALSALVLVFLLVDGLALLLEAAVLRTNLERLGFPPAMMRELGIGTLLLAILYAVPRTAIFGAILLTGLFGGIIATQIIGGSPVSRVLVGLLLGMLTWGGLFLRDPCLRMLMPLRRVP